MPKKTGSPDSIPSLETFPDHLVRQVNYYLKQNLSVKTDRQQYLDLGDLQVRPTLVDRTGTPLYQRDGRVYHETHKPSRAVPTVGLELWYYGERIGVYRTAHLLAEVVKGIRQVQEIQRQHN